jgi:fluoride exporter
MKLDRREVAVVFAGGMLGTLARVGLVQLFPAGDASWPWAVFLINISGTLLLGWVATTLMLRRPLSGYRGRFITTGFCSSYPTFSTMQLELLDIWNDHRYGLVAAYLGASVLCGYAAIHMTTALARGARVSG